MASTSDQDPTPIDCFPLQALQAFQAVENLMLNDVNYYLWLNRPSEGGEPYRFLYAIEWLFDNEKSLLVAANDDSTAILVSDLETLIRQIQALPLPAGTVTLQAVNAGAFLLWQPHIGHPLDAIRLSRNEEGLYLNDALVLDFGRQAILVSLSMQEGLEVGVL